MIKSHCLKKNYIKNHYAIKNYLMKIIMWIVLPATSDCETTNGNRPIALHYQPDGATNLSSGLEERHISQPYVKYVYHNNHGYSRGTLIRGQRVVSSDESLLRNHALHVSKLRRAARRFASIKCVSFNKRHFAQARRRRASAMTAERALVTHRNLLRINIQENIRWCAHRIQTSNFYITI